ARSGAQKSIGGARGATERSADEGIGESCRGQRADSEGVGRGVEGDAFFGGAVGNGNREARAAAATERSCERGSMTGSRVWKIFAGVLVILLFAAISAHA